MDILLFGSLFLYDGIIVEKNGLEKNGVDSVFSGKKHRIFYRKTRATRRAPFPPLIFRSLFFYLTLSFSFLILFP